MTISGTQASALPTTTAARAAATPASGDHGVATARSATTPNREDLFGPVPQLYSPFDRIQALLRDLMLAIQQLNQPIGQYPPIGPYGPYPPYEPPFDPYMPGCPHMDLPPIGPIDPPLPPGPAPTKKAPEVGDVLGATASTKGSPAANITVKSVHGSYKDRAKAVAAAKHLSGIFGDKPFGVAVSGLPGRERYTVVGLTSSAHLRASQSNAITSTVKDGWALDTIAFSSTKAKRIALGAPIGPVLKDATPPAPPAPPAPVPAPAPAPHDH
jgi:hypothetical protein